MKHNLTVEELERFIALTPSGSCVLGQLSRRATKRERALVAWAVAQGGDWRVLNVTPLFWDCECDGTYIHPKTQARCRKCGARADDQPDAHPNEVDALARKNGARRGRRVVGGAR